MNNPEIAPNKNKDWHYDKGLLHREDGPAVEDVNGYKAWFINGKLHRIDGPAVEHPNGSKLWYLNGKEEICILTMINIMK